MSTYYYVEPGETLTAARSAELAAAGVTVAVAARPSGTLGAGMGWAPAPPALVSGVLTQQWTQIPLPTPTLPQEAEALLASGCAVVSASAPSLSATYPLDQVHLAWLTSLIDGVAVSQGLPNSASTVLFPDVSGAMHAFTATQLVALGAALRNAFYTAQMVLAGDATALPAQPISIG